MSQQTAAAAPSFSVQRCERLADVSRDEWDRLAGGSNPFVRHAFMSGLEEHECLEDHGWRPCHLLARNKGDLVGALPLYLRSNSYGEFVFDWSWAEAFERAGGRYYPKLVSAVPFTPVIGPRLLVAPGDPHAPSIRAELIGAALELAEQAQLSSFHCLFMEPADAAALEQQGLMGRKTIQFHWHNRGYRDFDDFLDSLSSKRRKQLKRERRAAGEQGVEIERLAGASVSDEQWRVFYEFYCSTFQRRWGCPRFTLEFFQSLSREMPDETLLILARRGRRYIAGAFAMIGGDTLFGRHWGCTEDLPFLHFELCYYQTIEHCIHAGLKTVDAGVQGEHKLNRGFEPVGAPSCHWIRHPGFSSAIRRFLAQETPQVEEYIGSLRQHLPFRTS